MDDIARNAFQKAAFVRDLITVAHFMEEFWWLILWLSDDTVSTARVIWHKMITEYDHDWRVGKDMEWGGGGLYYPEIHADIWRETKKVIGQNSR
jgi:hypothetical protein